MNVLIAIDSFKGSLSSISAGKAAKEGILKVFPEANIEISPLADGGEGTVDAVISATHGEKKTVIVHDPLFRPIEASYGILPKTKTAVIEMAAASGLPLLSPNERNPLFTTTFGVGELIVDAYKNGCRDFVIGIGGSATNDGGVGMLQMLGVCFLDVNGKPIRLGAHGLADLADIQITESMDCFQDCRFRIACDVTNVLCGENGCSEIFSRQKGATEESIPQMDAWLHRYATLTRKQKPNADENIAGCGAAGGLGFAFLSYLNASLVSGIELVMEMTELSEKIKNADIIITGEGRLDGQTGMGKAPVGVAKLAKTYGKPVIALAGSVTKDAAITHNHGIDAIFPIVQAPCTLSEAMDTQIAYENLKNTAEEVFRLIQAMTSFNKNSS